MESTPLVSIIIPTYKGDISLIRAINSVLNQTYGNIEIIVVDDNYPNTKYRETTELLMKEYSNDKRVIYIKHDKNLNGAAARNTGFRNSRGYFIGFLDDDDIFLKNKIEMQVDYLKINEQYQAVYCWRYQHGEIIKSNKVGDLSGELLSLSFTPCTCSIMLKRECYEKLGGFDESYRRHQDYEFLLRFFEYYTIGVVNEPLVEIKGNEVNNALKGRELEELKNQFLNQFSWKVDKIDTKKKGFKKNVLAKHYSIVFWSYLKQCQIISALRIYFKYSFICGITFLIHIYIYLIDHLKMKYRKTKKASNYSKYFF
ncbi:glycosyltransferase family 2 protein [Syntrophomonas erecta subsp. sporosyntropha]